MNASMVLINIFNQVLNLGYLQLYVVDILSKYLYTKIVYILPKYINTWKEDAKGMDPGSFQWCSLTGPEAQTETEEVSGEH